MRFILSIWLKFISSFLSGDKNASFKQKRDSIFLFRLEESTLFESNASDLIAVRLEIYCKRNQKKEKL
jgi:hypothetical protein